eukprot:8912800-Alexandrium_andersonii.AAC.1
MLPTVAPSQDKLRFTDTREPYFKAFNQGGRDANQHSPAEVRVRQGLPHRARINARLRPHARRLNR